jgi:hypothetical protein
MLFLSTVLLLLLPIVAANDALIEWLRRNGGFFSEKVQFRPLDPNDDSSPIGLFANDALKRRETIIVLPQKCLFTTPPPQGVCKTARALAQQVREGENSFFKDYVNYLFDGKKHKQLPYRWSDDAKKILHEIAGDEFDLSISENDSFRSICGDGDDLEEDAWELLVSRSWREVMLPVSDIINHRVSLRPVPCYRNIIGSSFLLTHASQRTAAGEMSTRRRPI